MATKTLPVQLAYSKYRTALGYASPRQLVFSRFGGDVARVVSDDRYVYQFGGRAGWGVMAADARHGQEQTGQYSPALLGLE